jgi:hypothetical protein
MRLKESFLKLPVEFSADDMAQEVNALPPAAWVPHPEGYAGNDAVPLISPGGAMTNATAGRMAPTEFLRRCSYILGILAELGGPWGRSRLMRLGPGAEVRTHIDINYYWRTHLRIHIPVITNPGVRFTCGGETVHMAAGECWTFDSFRQHGVENKGPQSRVHLVIDTMGSERLFDLLEAARQDAPARTVGKSDVTAATPAFEHYNAPKVMTPWEVRSHIDYLTGHAEPHPLLAQATVCLDRFVAAWHGLWARFGDSDAGVPQYLQLVGATRESLQRIGGDVLLDNGAVLYTALDRLVFLNSVAGIKPKDLFGGVRGPALARPPIKVGHRISNIASSHRRK